MPTCMSAFGLHHGACSLSDTPAGRTQWEVELPMVDCERPGAGLRRVATEASSLRRRPGDGGVWARK